MKDQLERADNCAGVYRKSLLYLIREGLEPAQPTPILGLEIELRADAELAPIRGPVAGGQQVGEVVWSKTTQDQGGLRGASTSKSHGGFDDDVPTMDSVARRILYDAGAAQQPLAVSFDIAKDRDEARFAQLRTCLPDLAKRRDLLVDARPSPCGCGGYSDDADANALAWSDAIVSSDTASDDVAEIDASTSDASEALSSGAVASGGGRTRGRRRALCVGINAYRASPLTGCVRDAQRWRETLGRLGFSVRTIVDEAATRSAMLGALEDLVTSSRRGDMVVFQYSGHGTTLPDESGDEVAGGNGKRDEAICPVDYSDGAYLVDDDIAAVFARIPDGVNVTCFIDCCHSGTITRFAVGDPADPGGGRRARFLPATPQMIEAHRAFRRRLGGGGGRSRSALTGARGPDAMREVVFSACRDNEVAWENDGQGDFTRHATSILASGVGTLSNRAFQERVTAAFGDAPAQHPLLDCAAAARARPLLAAAGTAPTRAVGSSGSAGRSLADGAGAPIAQLLQAVAALVGRR
jgi:hypothetical protein